jgi:hypothetical protein
MKKIKEYFKEVFHKYFWRKMDTYKVLDTNQYYERFGIKYDEKKEKYFVKKKHRNKLQLAYEKAWETRNFEIDKFWTRATYFWGFIVLTFGGYISVITADPCIKMPKNIDLYLLLLGLLFSITWWLNIKGSKRWQENWEMHIDTLEDFITGPLYKTVYSLKTPIYSVSKLNELMSIAIILVWIGLIAEFLQNHICKDCAPDYSIIFSLLISILLTIALIKGYASGKVTSKEAGFINRHEK